MNEIIIRINGKIASTQYDEATINAARIEWDAARAELDNALDVADDYITANGYERLPRWFCPLETDAKGQAIQQFRADMWAPEVNPLRDDRRSRRHTNEDRPVGKARKEAATLRNLAKKLTKLVNA